MNIATLNNTLELLNSSEIVDFNLGDVEIDGQKLFRLGNIKRRDMPQLKGFPIKGSIAEALPVDKNGKVDVQPQFLHWLKRVHKIQQVRGRTSASQLKGAQSEIVASKVAEKVPKLMRDPKHKKFTQLYVADAHNTLLDGHHAWASIRTLGVLTQVDYRLQTLNVMCHIDQLIALANDFTSMVGIETKEGV